MKMTDLFGRLPESEFRRLADIEHHNCPVEYLMYVPPRVIRSDINEDLSTPERTLSYARRILQNHDPKPFAVCNEAIEVAIPKYIAQAEKLHWAIRLLREPKFDLSGYNPKQRTEMADESDELYDRLYSMLMEMFFITDKVFGWGLIDDSLYDHLDDDLGADSEHFIPPEVTNNVAPPRNPVLN